MVIIFDALDEYKDIVDLLDVLVKLILKMPPKVKIFFTSHPNSKIEAQLQHLEAEELGLYPATNSVMEAFFWEQLGSAKRWQGAPQYFGSSNRPQNVCSHRCHYFRFMWSANTDFF
jgi:hypothetical protein